jgi:hypothetical protein
MVVMKVLRENGLTSVSEYSCSFSYNRDICCS